MKTKRPSSERVTHGIYGSAIRNCGYSDHRTKLQVIRKCDPEAVGEIDSGSQGCAAGAGVNQDLSTVPGRPGTIFVTLMAGANEPCPWLVDGEKTHRNP